MSKKNKNKKAIKNENMSKQLKLKNRRKRLTKIFIWVMLFALLFSVLIGAGIALFSYLG